MGICLPVEAAGGMPKPVESLFDEGGTVPPQAGQWSTGGMSKIPKIGAHPVEDGRYRACWTVRAGALFFGGTTKPPVKTEGLEERSTLWVAGAGFALCIVQSNVAERTPVRGAVRLLIS